MNNHFSSLYKNPHKSNIYGSSPFNIKYREPGPILYDKINQFHNLDSMNESLNIKLFANRSKNKITDLVLQNLVYSNNDTTNFNKVKIQHRSAKKLLDQQMKKNIIKMLNLPESKTKQDNNGSVIKNIFIRKNKNNIDSSPKENNNNEISKGGFFNLRNIILAVASKEEDSIGDNENSSKIMSKEKKSNDLTLPTVQMNNNDDISIGYVHSLTTSNTTITPNKTKKIIKLTKGKFPSIFMKNRSETNTFQDEKFQKKRKVKISKPQFNKVKSLQNLLYQCQSEINSGMKLNSVIETDFSQKKYNYPNKYNNVVQNSEQEETKKEVIENLAKREKAKKQEIERKKMKHKVDMTAISKLSEDYAYKNRKKFFFDTENFSAGDEDFYFDDEVERIQHKIFLKENREKFQKKLDFIFKVNQAKIILGESQKAKNRILSIDKIKPNLPSQNKVCVEN